ncbi:hypothetical protein [Thermoactinomyces sp. DSM 45892]|uniref:hypothetical protein n=1 Tax=Thermoactinomyces sp. DSM 45892 TaxID=1882753 RepID=UPI00089B0F7E|nr:hypothetical protein [Thermoactinomyces sp. DSM 45892]SDX93485.1 hypothetical protein SAMN05444416_10146 [Thermoactinomyces sp. DSM 45892]
MSQDVESERVNEEDLKKPSSAELKSLYEKLDKVPFIDMSRENVSLFRMIIAELLEQRDETKRNNGSMKILE